MTQAYYTGLSGLQNYTTAIDVVSDNIANSNTVGFRSTDTEFASLFEESLAQTADNGSSVGLGVRVNATSMNTQSGSLIATERFSDLAIDGDGWFGVSNTDGSVLYTKDGRFDVDSEGNLVTEDGYYLLGTMGDNISEDGVLEESLDEVDLAAASSQTKLQLPQTLTYPPTPTASVSFDANLGTGYESITMGSTVVDGENNQNNLELTFQKNETQTPPGTQYSLTATITSADGETSYATEEGSVFFDENGGFAGSTLNSIDNNGQLINFDFGTGFDGLSATNTTQPYANTTADGSLGGDLAGYSIDNNGDILASFTNGEQSSIGKVAVYHFQNDQGLSRLSGSRFTESSNSGAASFYTDADGNTITGSNILSYNLESSNVDMTAGLTDLIVMQRSYDANSKSITTADEMIQKALEMDAG